MVVISLLCPSLSFMFFHETVQLGVVDLCCFHPILVTWFLVIFGDEVTKILRNFVYFSFCLARLALQTESIVQKN